MIARTPLDRALRLRTALGMSSRNNVELGHGSGSVSEVEITYLGVLLSAGNDTVQGYMIHDDDTAHGSFFFERERVETTDHPSMWSE
jgi:hypothetical protein